MRAAATALLGLGLTLASTFAGSLGLSVHLQRAGFVIGVLLMAAGVALIVLHRHRAGRKPPTPIPGVPMSHYEQGLQEATRGRSGFGKFTSGRRSRPRRSSPGSLSADVEAMNAQLDSPEMQRSQQELADTLRALPPREPIRWDQIASRPEPGEGLPFKPWLEGRLGAHADLVRQRPARSEQWWLAALAQWDVRNTFELQTKVAPDLVDDYYRGNGVPGYRPGQEQEYYDRQLGWLRDKLAVLRRSEEAEFLRSLTKGGGDD